MRRKKVSKMKKILAKKEQKNIQTYHEPVRGQEIEQKNAYCRVMWPKRRERGLFSNVRGVKKERERKEMSVGLH